jgi:hypothetical protein
MIYILSVDFLFQITFKKPDSSLEIGTTSFFIPFSYYFQFISY